MPASIGRIISSRHATLVELQTVLGIEDAYALIEVIAVDAYNERQLSKTE